MAQKQIVIEEDDLFTIELLFISTIIILGLLGLETYYRYYRHIATLVRYSILELLPLGALWQLWRIGRKNVPKQLKFLERLRGDLKAAEALKEKLRTTPLQTEEVVKQGQEIDHVIAQLQISLTACLIAETTPQLKQLQERLPEVKAISESLKIS